MSNSVNYYEIMGLTPSATAEEVKARYRELAKKYHPDLNENGEREAEIMRQCNEAYAVLSDPERRAKHDKEIGVMSGARHQNRGPIVTRNTLEKAGAPARASVSISFEDAFTGCVKRIEYRASSRCKECNGEAYTQGSFGNKIPCYKCGGKGVVDKAVFRDINIYSGVQDGATVTVPGAGGEAPIVGKPNGDLFVQVTVEPSDKFKRDGFDVRSTTDIPLEVAILGGVVTVETVTGPKQIKVSPSTKTIRQLSMAGMGFPLGDGTTGAHKFEVRVSLPEIKTSEQREAFKAFVASLENGRQPMGALDLSKGR